MYEVELKVPADVDEVRDRLLKRGVDADQTLRQVDTYYDAPDRDFAETDEALRIRTETSLSAAGDDADGGNASGREGTTTVTYKGPLVDADSKTREEHETTVVDGDELAAILEGLGYEPAATVEKRREFHTVGGFTVALDRVDGVGEFVEIERTVADEGDVAAVREEAAATLRGLGLDANDQIRTSYLGLLLAEET